MSVFYSCHETKNEEIQYHMMNFKNRKMVYPEKLKKGDLLGVVCPSSPIYNEAESRIQRAVAIIESMGFRVKLADNIRDNYGGYLAGRDFLRAKWLHTMFADASVKGIVCGRGGYGSSRLMECLDFSLIRKNPKIFVGYSDITSLHLALNQICNLVTFHGPMAFSNMGAQWDEETENSFLQAVTGNLIYPYQSPKGYSIGILKKGRAAGILIGGNLSLLSASIGTPYEVDTRGKILFLEEVGEAAGSLDRYIFHLKNAGKFRHCRGILLGQFTQCENSRMKEYDYLACFREALKNDTMPVMYRIQSGHGTTIMTLPLGSYCFMDTEEKRVVFR